MVLGESCVRIVARSSSANKSRESARIPLLTLVRAEANVGAFDGATFWRTGNGDAGLRKKPRILSRLEGPVVEVIVTGSHFSVPMLAS